VTSAPKRGERLLLVALCLGLHGERHHRARQVRHPQIDLLVRGAQHVACVGLLQLGHRADVAGAELLGVIVLLPLWNEQLSDSLLLMRAGVEDV